MAKNDIRLDQIEARLGRVQKTYASDPYSDDGDGQYEEPFEYEGDRVSGKKFYASIASVFAAVLLATMFVPFGKLQQFLPWGNSGFVSVVENQCGSSWRESGRNDKSLICYLTAHVERLCDPRERSHLASVMKRYRSDRVTHEAHAAVNSIKSIVNFQSTVQKSIASQISNFDKPFSSRRGYQSSDNDMRDFMKSMDRLRKGMGGFGVTSPNTSTSEDPDVNIRMAIRHLGYQGYMIQSDFGWFPDKLVTASFDGLQVEKDSCAK